MTDAKLTTHARLVKPASFTGYSIGPAITPNANYTAPWQWGIVGFADNQEGAVLVKPMPNDQSPQDRELLLRMRETAEKIFANAKFAQQFKREHELVERSKKIMERVHSVVMEVVNTDAARGGKFDPRAANNLIEKMIIEQFKSWDKDELLFIATLIHTGIILEKVQEAADMGLIGNNKDFPV